MQSVPSSTPSVDLEEGALPPRPVHDQSFVMRYGRFIHRARWFILVIWVLGLAASVPFAASISSRLVSSITQPGDTESARVGQQLVHTFHQPQSRVLAVFRSTSVPVADASY